MDCNTCKHKQIYGECIYCGINVPDSVFMIGCEHEECPNWEGEEE